MENCLDGVDDISCQQLSSFFLLVSVVMLIGSFITALLKIHSVLIYYLDFPRGWQEPTALPGSWLVAAVLGMSQPEKKTAQSFSWKPSTVLLGSPRYPTRVVSGSLSFAKFKSLFRFSCLILAQQMLPCLNVNFCFGVGWMADIVSQHSFQAPESSMSLSGNRKQPQLFCGRWEGEVRFFR